VAQLESGALRIVLNHAHRTTVGMRQVLLSADDAGDVHIESTEHLRSYCYIVAGIVGELLTEVFVNDCPALYGVLPTLVEHQAAFGEGLQLVNILKDESVDRGEGRSYLPVGVTRSELLELARHDIKLATTYIATLQRGGAPGGFVAFCSLSAQLADASLVVLDRDGPGAKVSRLEVMRIFAEVMAATARGASQTA
jgi:farnesyl-diphosphate farnesyltransferase